MEGRSQMESAASNNTPLAVIRTGGKQYRVSPGQRVDVEKLDAAKGDSITLTEVLAVRLGADLKLGSPLVSGATVTAKVVDTFRDDKVVIFKKRRRKGYTKKQGHRQSKMTLLIESINA